MKKKGRRLRKKPLQNAKAKGSRNEHKTRDWIKKTWPGKWVIIRSAASLGPADLIAINLRTHELAVIQVKSNCWPGTKEMAVLREIRCEMSKEWHDAPWNVLLVRWDDYDRKPALRWL